MKRGPVEQEKIFANKATNQGLISEIYKSSYNSTREKQRTQSKIGRRPE